MTDGLTEDLFAPRPMSTEEALARQEERIAYLRSAGKPWAEAVYQLRDMLVGFEDDEFWDGVPPHLRGQLAALPEEQQERLRAQWAPEGWHGYHVRAIPVRDATGRIVPVYRPTAENLSHAYRILRRLMDRCGFVRKTRRVSRLTPRPGTEADDEALDAAMQPQGL
jgi:hypothetical protein